MILNINLLQFLPFSLVPTYPIKATVVFFSILAFTLISLILSKGKALSFINKILSIFIHYLID